VRGKLSLGGLGGGGGEFYNVNGSNLCNCTMWYWACVVETSGIKH